MTNSRSFPSVMEVLYWQKQRRRTHLLSYHVGLKQLPYIQNVLGSIPRGTNGASCGSLCRLQRLTLWSSQCGTNEGLQFYSRAHVKVEHTQTEPEPSVHYTCIIKKKKPWNFIILHDHASSTEQPFSDISLQKSSCQSNQITLLLLQKIYRAWSINWTRCIW